MTVTLPWTGGEPLTEERRANQPPMKQRLGNSSLTDDIETVGLPTPLVTGVRLRAAIFLVFLRGGESRLLPTCTCFTGESLRQAC